MLLMTRSYSVAKFIYNNRCFNNFTKYVYQASLPICKHDLELIRCKSKSSKVRKQEDSGTEAEEGASTFEDEIVDKNSKILNIKVSSLRTDLLLKAGLGIARNKIETMFYDSKIRVNGKKIFKKSMQVQVGDEIDIIKGVSVNNPKFLTVARVEVLSANGKDDISVKLRRCKSLIVENYEESSKSNE